MTREHEGQNQLSFYSLCVGDYILYKMKPMTKLYLLKYGICVSTYSYHNSVLHNLMLDN